MKRSTIKGLSSYIKVTAKESRFGKYWRGQAEAYLRP